MFDYENLRLLAWAIVGLLLIGFTITDGFDLGAAALLPVIGKSNEDRRVMINSIAPHWDGNQVWLITAGGAIFAVWPSIYGVTFSGFYIAMMLALASLWLRPIGMDYRAKIDNPQWRKACDIALVISGVVPSVIFGVGFGNLLIGVPFEFNSILIMTYKGSFFNLLTPFPLLCGLISLGLMVTQGSAFLQLKTKDDIQARSRRMTVIAASTTALLFVLGGFYALTLPGYLITSPVVTDLASNPLAKNVIQLDGQLLHNYISNPLLWTIPLLGIGLLTLASIFAHSTQSGKSFLCSSLAIACVILTAGTALFPMVVPSSIHPSHSLTLWDSTSSQLTLSIIIVVAIVVVPVIIGYTSWCYYKMFGKLDHDFIRNNDSSLY
ncbi:cytochrome d ubiquinol oxidase subunit II [Vibrio sp. TBV020]|uniref:cytochrome d ubiquinol oxidase subunit II n=1 Tax=Vibrio sp. TBV020 TaxID=3137398 RepID=UPI0038CD64C3